MLITGYIDMFSTTQRLQIDDESFVVQQKDIPRMIAGAANPAEDVQVHLFGMAEYLEDLSTEIEEEFSAKFNSHNNLTITIHEE